VGYDVGSRKNPAATSGESKECSTVQEVEMRVGMLWLDDDRRMAIDERVDRAVAYYRGKYGRKPNLCIVHPSTLGEEMYEGGQGVELRTSHSVLPDHLWLGVREAEGLKTAAAMD
jgi:hypothetical protein